MNYLLDTKQDSLIIPNGETIACNQQSALDFPLFLSFFIFFPYILLCFFPLFRVLFHLFALLKSYAARSCIHSHVIPIDCR
ncbi:TPA: hypothetical protein NGJ40_003056 [Legionella pneumophila]|nr:hypothetical protein [Legionella pneumophila]